MSALDDEFREIHNYVRHVAQLSVAWYTFFVTGNLVAAGWFSWTTTKQDPLLEMPGTVWAVCLVFLAVNVLGILVCAFVRRYFLQADSRIKEILLSLSSDSSSSQPPATSPVPLVLLCRSAVLMMLSLVVLMCAWVSLLVLKSDLVEISIKIACLIIHC